MDVNGQGQGEGQGQDDASAADEKKDMKTAADEIDLTPVPVAHVNDLPIVPVGYSKESNSRTVANSVYENRMKLPCMNKKLTEQHEVINLNAVCNT